MFIVLSGFSGLKTFTLQFSTIVDPDLKVLPLEGKSFEVTPSLLDSVSSLDEVSSVAQVIEERVVVNYEAKNEIVTLKGIDDNFPQSTIDSILVQGSWFRGYDNQVVSGWGVSNNLELGVLQFDKTLHLYVPKPGKGQMTSIKGAYNSVKAINTGVFQINEELDNSFVFTSFNMAKNLLNYKEGQISAIEIKLHPDSEHEDVKAALYNIFGDLVIIKDKFQLNDALYKMLNTENLVVYLIFLLVLIIALFNVIGSLIMMILDKKKNLKTLFNLGTTVRDIRRVFFLQGSLMVLLGGGIGLALGFILVALQKSFGWVPITPSLPYPVEIKVINFIIVIATISILGIVVSKLASSRISKNLIAVS